MRIARGIVWMALALLAALAFACSGRTVLLAVALSVLAVPLVCWIAVARAAHSVHATLSSATTAIKGTPIEVRLSVRSDSRVPLAHVRATVQVENLLTGETDEIPASASVPPRSAVDVPLLLESAHCGRIACTVRDVRLFELFRIFSRRAPVGAERRFTVMPMLREAHLRDVYAASPLSDTTVFSPFVKGSDLAEVFALREYAEGDELKRIHWKLSEKIDRMIVRDASLPLDNALLLFWDKSIPASAASDPVDAAARADAMAEVVLALMEQLTRAGATFETASNDIPAGSCPRMFVTDEGGIYEAIGQLLSAPVAVCSEAGIDAYRRCHGKLSCSRLIYVCAERPVGLEGALGMCEALLLVCDGARDMLARPQMSEIHFPPDGVREVLAMAGAM